MQEETTMSKIKSLGVFNNDQTILINSLQKETVTYPFM